MKRIASILVCALMCAVVSFGIVNLHGHVDVTGARAFLASVK
jgi:hypothetical protein